MVRDDGPTLADRVAVALLNMAGFPWFPIWFMASWWGDVWWMVSRRNTSIAAGITIPTGKNLRCWCSEMWTFKGGQPFPCGVRPPPETRCGVLWFFCGHTSELFLWSLALWLVIGIWRLFHRLLVGLIIDIPYDCGSNGVTQWCRSHPIPLAFSHMDHMSPKITILNRSNTNSFL